MQPALSGYVELHCHSAYSLREGASLPVELVLRARELGYPALALTDHDGLYGAMAFAQTANAWGVRPITGAEVTLSGGSHLTLLAATREGYGNLCRLLSSARMANREQPALDPMLLSTHAAGLIILSGCRQSEVAAALATGDEPGAAMILRRYRDWFGPNNVFVELQQNLVFGDTARNAALVALARELGLPVVATNNVHYHVRERHRLQDTLVAIRHRTNLDACHQERRPNSEFYLKPPTEMAALFHDIPEAIANTQRIAERCTFNLATDLDYAFPDYEPPTGETPDAYLARLCREALQQRYSPLAPGLRRQAEERLAEELRLIARHGLAGYVLHYRDLMLLAGRVADELNAADPSRPRGRAWGAGRGRGSSVGSIVCYLIGLSHIDPITTGLFLGRFLNDELPSIPDIDLDFPRDVRATLLERIFAERGPEGAALVCTFPTYQAKSAIRDVGKALGLPEWDLDSLARQVGHARATQLGDELARLPTFRDRAARPLWQHLLALAEQLDGFPRHVSQHVGGVVLSSHPLNELVPLEPAAMEGRLLCGWDKDSVDDARFVKIDFLALGMLSLVDECLGLIAEHRGRIPDLGRIRHDDARVFDMICQGDTLGVFQIESRAQTQTLPRTRPRSIADLTVEVAIIRPGPVVGGAVNPYIRRRQGREPVTYDHPSLEPALAETLGVILYQEQILQVSMAIAGFSAGQAESLRRAMSRKRSREAMLELWQPFCEGALQNGVDEAVAARVFEKLLGFATFGFPKSHSAAFALLAYESAWLKFYYPTEFYAALLNNQPMGFYSPEVLLGDAKRHGIDVLPVDVNDSQSRCTVEDGKVRLGFRYVQGIGPTQLRRLDAARREGPYASLRDFCRGTGLARVAVENLIRIGAFARLGLRRRELLWQLGLLYCPEVHHAATERGGANATTVHAVQEALPLPIDQDMVTLPPTSAREQVEADYAILGLSTRQHCMALVRPYLGEGIASSRHLAHLRNGIRLTVAGLVVCRQRPETAKGMLFLTLEDEWGLANVIVRPQIYERDRSIIRTTPLVLVEGILQRRDGTINIVASQVRPMPHMGTIAAPEAKNFH